jgi:hypothetical protein
MSSKSQSNNGVSYLGIPTAVRGYSWWSLAPPATNNSREKKPMYAVIIQSAVNASAVRQTAIVPQEAPSEPRVFTRLGAGQRGTAGAWSELSCAEVSSSMSVTASAAIVGEPVSITVTASDARDLVGGGFPGTLLQKLVRAARRTADGASETEAEGEGSVVGRILHEATSTPAVLVRYIRGLAPSAPRPLVIQREVMRVPEQAADTVVSAPVMQAEPFITTWTDLNIPQASDPVVAGYVERSFPGGRSETEVYDFARLRGEAVNIVGPAGTGKTSSARAYAAKRGLPFVVFECNPQVDEEVVQGTYIPTGNGTELRWRYSALATALSQPSVVLLNESNRMTAKANALFLAILQERELRVSRHAGEVLSVHPDCLIIADSNDGYRGTQKSDQAFLDRFNMKVEFAYDRKVEAEFIPSTTLLDMATRLREDADRESTFSTPVSTRILKNFVSQAQGLGWEFAYDSFLNNFPTTERDALGMVFTTYSHGIKRELGLLAGAEPVVETADEDELLISGF